MHNVQMQIADHTLLICVGLDGRPAKPGRTEIIASTMGNVTPDGRPDLRVALMVYAPGPRMEAFDGLDRRIEEILKLQGPGK